MLQEWDTAGTGGGNEKLDEETWHKDYGMYSAYADYCYGGDGFDY